MSSKKLSVPQVKIDLKKIIENLKLLENPIQLDPKNFKELKQETHILLTELERKPLEKLKKKTKKQKEKRKHKKLIRLKYKKESEIYEKVVESSNSEYTNEQTPPYQNTQIKSQHHIKSLKECQRFLRIFNLLEQLHLARGQDPNETQIFSNKLENLKNVWNTVLQENKNEYMTTEEKIHQEWNKTLFGSTENIFKKDEEKSDMKDFLRKRYIWDSFIDNKNGTSIPIGWVLPPQNPSNEWSQYLIKE